MGIAQRVFVIAISFTLLMVAVSCASAATPVPPTLPQPSAILPPPTATPIEFVWKITRGSSPLDTPTGLGLDPQGNLFVVDAGNSRIQKFDSNGKFLLEWGSHGDADGQFAFPQYGQASVAVDAKGNVYVTDGLNARIQKFDSNGRFLNKWDKQGTGDGEFTQPMGMGVDRLGNVYVVDNRNLRIQKFDSNGRFLSQWGSRGTRDGQINDPGFISFDGQNNLYIADNGNGRLQKFDSNGTFLTKWSATCGEGQHPFMSPIGVAIDEQGNIFVTDYSNSRVCKFDSNGQFLNTWGSKGLADGQFTRPTGIAIDQQGSIYVADSGNNSVQKFRQP